MLLLVSTASSMEFKTLSTKPLRSWDCSSVSSVGLPKTFSLFLVCLQWETLKCSDNLSEWHGGTVILLLALSAWRFFSYFCSVLGDCFWQRTLHEMQRSEPSSHLYLFRGGSLLLPSKVSFVSQGFTEPEDTAQKLCSAIKHWCHWMDRTIRDGGRRLKVGVDLGRCLVNGFPWVMDNSW